MSFNWSFLPKYATFKSMCIAWRLFKVWWIYTHQIHEEKNFLKSDSNKRPLLPKIPPHRKDYYNQQTPLPTEPFTNRPLYQQTTSSTRSLWPENTFYNGTWRPKWDILTQFSAGKFWWQDILINVDVILLI